MGISYTKRILKNIIVYMEIEIYHVCISNFANFLKIKQETIRKCHICSKLLQAVLLNFSRDMLLFLSATRAFLMKNLRNTYL